MQDNRNLPYSQSAESALLGGVIWNNEILEEVRCTLKENHFFSPINQKIYKIMLELMDDKVQIEEISLMDRIKTDGAGIDSDYVIQLFQSCPTPENYKIYMDILIEKYNLRKLYSFASTIQRNAMEEIGSQKILDDISNFEETMGDVATIFEYRESRGLVLDRIDALERRAKGEVNDMTPSGYHDLDMIIDGWFLGYMDIVAGRPAMGKTSFGLCYILSLMKQNKQVAIITLELSKEQLIDKMLCMKAKISFSNFHKANLEANQWDDLLQASEFIMEKNAMVDSSSVNINQLIALIRKLKRKHGTEYILIDYVQKVECDKGSTRDEEMGFVSRKLSNIARELNIHVLLLAQLNRSVEKREDKRPVMSDLRESGNLEQDAYRIMFLYRDEYYYPEKQDTEGLADLIVCKNRNGQTGTVTLQFDKEHTLFRNLKRS